MQGYGFTEVFPRLLQVHEQGQQHRARSRCRYLLLFWSTRKLDHPQRFGCACHLVDKLWGVHFLIETVFLDVCLLHAERLVILLCL